MCRKIAKLQRHLTALGMPLEAKAGHTPERAFGRPGSMCCWPAPRSSPPSGPCHCSVAREWRSSWLHALTRNPAQQVAQGMRHGPASGAIHMLNDADDYSCACTLWQVTCCCLLTRSTASGSDLSTALICFDQTTTALSRMCILALSFAVWSGCCVSAAGIGSTVWPLASPMLTFTAGWQVGMADMARAHLLN